MEQACILPSIFVPHNLNETGLSNPRIGIIWRIKPVSNALDWGRRALYKSKIWYCVVNIVGFPINRRRSFFSHK